LSKSISKHPNILCHQDFLDCIPLRTAVLIEKNKNVFKGAKVLEIGPFIGHLSVPMAFLAKHLTVIENNRACIKYLKSVLGRKSKIIFGDVHNELSKILPGTMDIVVCAGILYHSASPLQILEGICRLRPRKILIDTMTCKDTEKIRIIENVPVNYAHYRFSDGHDCGMSVILSEKIIDSALVRMGYKRINKVKKSHLKSPSRASKNYFRQWRAGFSAWYEVNK
jgi:2-polyprenyl-3-methyl-5-hydroxy-6-metoxy-1,4-benzoquinol methylase